MFCSHGIGLGYTFTPEWLVVPVSLLLALVVGGMIGALNGWLVVRLKMNAFIVTLASYIWVRGLVVAVSGGRSAQDLPPSLRFIGIETVALHAAHRLDRHCLLCAVLLHHGEDALRPPHHDDRRQCGGDLPRRHQG